MRAMFAAATLALAACQQDASSIRPRPTTAIAQPADAAQAVVPALCAPTG
jgi:uncharacterized lipoprotein YajG